jgi:signal transduction histidine kinase
METQSLGDQPLKEQQEQQVNYNGKLELLSPRTERSIICDPQKISQVLFNILDNALKFTNKGQVIVTISEKNKAIEESAASQDKKSEEVLVSIRDTGTGVDPSMKDRLFQRFATQSVKGTGLGLYLSKKIIEAHGGRIWAGSNNDGSQGSTFTFSLPVAGPG